MDLVARVLDDRTMSIGVHLSDSVEQPDLPCPPEAPVQAFQVRRPWMAVGLGLALPVLYMALWHAMITEQMRVYGRCKEDGRLSEAKPWGSLVAFTMGGLLVLPAAVCLLRTVRRVQRCEELCFGQSRPAGGLVGLLVVVQVLGLLASLVTGVTVGVPLSLLIPGVATIAILQPRLNAVWRAETGELLEPGESRPGNESAASVTAQRLRSAALRCWAELPGGLRGVTEWASGILAYGALVVGGTGVFLLGRMFAAQDRSGLFAGLVTAVAVIVLGLEAGRLVGCSLRGLARLTDGSARGTGTTRRASVDRPLLAVTGLGLAATVPWLWSARPLFHGLLMPIYEWPLVTWIPLALGVLFTVACALVSVGARRGVRPGLRVGTVWRVPVTVVLWVAFMVALPSLQGQALYDATTYSTGDLPLSTQPRVLPKAAAQAYAADASLHDAHLVIDAATHTLVWSAEQARGFLRRGVSGGVVAQPLDRVDGTQQPDAGGFDPAVSRVGPGSLQWRAYDRHWFTRVQDAVIVPLGGGQAIAVAPYLGYRGFPVRHPYWAGVYVYHQDGRLEDLTPREALARPELVASGRLFPERLARAIVEAYGYRTGAAAVLTGRARTEVGDPSGNPQPYLTNLSRGRVSWVTVAHPAGDDSTVAAVFLTDSSTGRTQVWHPPRGVRLLSNTGAVQTVQALPLQWEGCCDGNGNGYWIRKVVEPTPVFAHGHLFYLVSIVPNTMYLSTAQPVDETIIVDAQRGTVVGQYDHADPTAASALLNFFTRRR